MKLDYRSVVVLSAHPDDAEMNAGGTIARLVDQGADVNIVTCVIPENPVRRAAESELAASVLGARWWGSERLDKPDEFTDNFSTISYLDNFTGAFAPDLIISHHTTDSHQDHRTTARIALALARSNGIDLWAMWHSIPGGLVGQPTPTLLVKHSTEQSKRKEQSIECHSDITKAQRTGIMARDWYLGATLTGQMTDDVRAEGFTFVKGAAL